MILDLDSESKNNPISTLFVTLLSTEYFSEIFTNTGISKKSYEKENDKESLPCVLWQGVWQILREWYSVK